MAAVILGTLFIGGFESQRSGLFAVHSAVAAASVLAIVLSIYALDRIFRQKRAFTTQPWLLIVLDSILAIGVLAVIDVERSPLAWVALITPVLETAVFFSVTSAAISWLGLSLAFLALRLTVSASDDATTETLVLSIQQVLAVLFVSGPAALMADAAQDRIASLASARRDAHRNSERLREIAQSARAMSGLASLDEILSLACETASSIGFDQSDVVVKDADGRFFVHSSNSKSGTSPHMPAQILNHDLHDAVGSIYADDPRHGSTLKLSGIGSGHALEISSADDAPEVVLRVWSKKNYVSSEDLRALALLGGHTREAYRATQLLQEAQLHRDQLLYEVRHDNLTGLANRAYVLESLTNRVSARQPLALFFIDLDGFKAINDTLGHKAGDDALVAVAQRLNHTGRDDAFAGRMGGDEFVVLIPMTRFETIESLTSFSDRIVQSINEPIVADGKPAQLGASIGVAIHDGHMGADQLISLADDAMYEAKRRGGGTVFSPASLTTFAHRSAS